MGRNRGLSAISVLVCLQNRSVTEDGAYSAGSSKVSTCVPANSAEPAQSSQLWFQFGLVKCTRHQLTKFRTAGFLSVAFLLCSSDEEPDPDIVMPEGKVGAKKMRKLEEKAEKKRQREVRTRCFLRVHYTVSYF